MTTKLHDENYYHKQAKLELEFEGRVGPGIDEINKRISEIKNRYVEFSGKVKNLQAELNKQDQIFSKISSSVNVFNSSITKLGSVFGATSIGFVSGLQNLNRYNIELRASAAQFVKYGQGISQTKAQVESLSETFQLTRQQTIELMSSFESGFNFARIESMPGLFEKIADSVGTSKEAMAGMAQSLNSIANNSPQFSAILMGAFDGTKSAAEAMKSIESAGYALIASGKIGVAEAKKLEEFLSGGSALSKEDQEKKEQIDEQMKFFRSMNKLFEDISLSIGGEIVPYAKSIGESIISIKQDLIPIIKFAVIGGAALQSLSGLTSFGKVILSLREMKELAAGTRIGSSFMKSGVGSGIGRALGVGASTAAGGVGASSVGGAGSTLALGAGATVVASIATAIAGIFAGSYLSKEIGLGRAGNAKVAEKVERGYDNLTGENELDRLKIQRAKKEAELEKKRLRGQWYALGLDTDFIQKNTPFISNDILSKYGSGRKMSDSEAAEMNRLNMEIRAAEEKEKQLEKTKKLEEADKKRLLPLAQAAREIASVTDLTDLQNSKLQAQLSLMESILKVSGMNRAGGGAESYEAINRSRQELQEQASILESSKDVILKNVERARSAAGAAGPQTMAEYNSILAMKYGSEERNKAEDEFAQRTGIQIGSETRYLEIQRQIKDIEAQRATIGLSVLKVKEPALEQVKLETQLLETQVNLANAYGFGLRATVQMQMQQVSSIEEQKNLIRGQIQDLAVQREIDLKTAKTKEEFDRAEFNYKNEVLKKQNELTAATAKQAEITKSLREGYISAIAAMTTGAGVFTRIVMSQEKRLGNLVFGSPNKIRALRAGSELEGRREFGRIGAGYLTEGSAGEAEKATLSQYGDFLDYGDIRKGAESATVRVQSMKSSVAAAVADNLYGTSQALDEHKKATEQVTTSLTRFATSIDSVFVNIVDSNGVLKSSLQNSNPLSGIMKDSNEIKNIFIETLSSVKSPEVISAFRQAMADVAVTAAKEAIPQVLKEMRQA